MEQEQCGALLVPLDSVVSQPVRWLWPGMIPRGKLVILCGDPGIGKSFLTLDIAARASRGGDWPDVGEGHQSDGIPASTILLSAEDDPADTIRPRLEQMGADTSKIQLLEGIRQHDGSIYDFVISENTKHLRETIANMPGVGCVIVDPISAYVGATDSYNNAQVRSMLKPLSDLASDHGVAVILVTHLRKQEAAKMLHRAMGSLAFTAAARVVLCVTRDRQDQDIRVLVTAKSNIGTDRVGFNYTIEDGRLVWGACFDAGADGADEVEKRAQSPENETFAFRLKNALSSAGTLPSADVRKIADEAGAKWASVSALSFKRRNGFVTVGFGRSAVWKLDKA